jgi:hypothetical protein
MKKLTLLLALFIVSQSFGNKNILQLKSEIVKAKLELFDSAFPSEESILYIKNEVEKYGDEELNILFSGFHSLYSNKENSIDTLLKTMILFSNKFYSDFSQIIFDDLNAQQQKKIILFTTSMSCDCTLKMCSDYEKALHQLKDFDFIIVDTFYDEVLWEKFNISFVPVIIILDEENNELTRFVRDEEPNIFLRNFLTNQIN